MSKKNQKTECSGMSWGDFLILVEKLKKCEDYQFLLFISVGCYCGLRAGDILKMKWVDILNKTEINITERKTGKTRCIIFNESLRETINRCYAYFQQNTKKSIADLNTTIFNNRKGKVMSLQYINRQLHTIFNTHKVNVYNPSSHTCRKTFGKRIYEMNNKSDASLTLLSHIFNHSSTAITRKYIGIQQEQIKDVYLSL